MKRGEAKQRIGLAVGSIVTIAAIFAIVLILSGRTVMPVNNIILLNSEGSATTIYQENPCKLIRCMQGKESIFLGFEEIGPAEIYAKCVCATIRDGEAYYDEMQIKKIQTTRRY